MKRALLALLLFAPVAFADMMGPGTPTYLCIGAPLVVNLIFNFALLYAILKFGFAYKNKNKIFSGALIGTAGGFIIDYVAYFVAGVIALQLAQGTDLVQRLRATMGLMPMSYFAVSAVLLFAFYFLLAKGYFKLPNHRAFLVGVVMALLTNPVIGLMLFGY